MLSNMLPWLGRIGNDTEPDGPYMPWNTDDSARQPDPEPALAHDYEPAITSDPDPALVWIGSLASLHIG